MNKAVFFDRDGTLIKHIPYLCEVEKVELKLNISKLINFLIEKNFYIFLHTNQSGVNKGLFTIKDVESCNNKMIDLIGLGDFFKEKCIATDKSTGKNSFRKPSNKFAFNMQKKYNLDFKKSFYVGDSICDLESALLTNCNFILINNEVESKTLKVLKKYPKTIVFNNVDDIIEFIKLN